METTHITVYIDDKPYRFNIKVDHEKEETTYQVDTDTDLDLTEEYIPSHLLFSENGKVTLEQNLKTVEQEQIARLIWQEIINKMKPQ